MYKPKALRLMNNLNNQGVWIENETKNRGKFKKEYASIFYREGLKTIIYIETIDYVERLQIRIRFSRKGMEYCIYQNNEPTEKRLKEEYYEGCIKIHDLTLPKEYTNFFENGYTNLYKDDFKLSLKDNIAIKKLNLNELIEVIQDLKKEVK